MRTHRQALKGNWRQGSPKWRADLLLDNSVKSQYQAEGRCSLAPLHMMLHIHGAPWDIDPISCITSETKASSKPAESISLAVLPAAQAALQVAGPSLKSQETGPLSRAKRQTVRSTSTTQQL